MCKQDSRSVKNIRIYLTSACDEYHRGCIIIGLPRKRWFLRRVQNQTSDDVVFPLRTFFYTISPHDISFLIVDSTTSNRVNRLFFLTAFHSTMTFNFLRSRYRCIQKTSMYMYHRGDMYGKLRACMWTRYWHVGHLIKKKTQPAKGKDLSCTQLMYT